MSINLEILNFEPCFKPIPLLFESNDDGTCSEEYKAAELVAFDSSDKDGRLDN